MKEMKQLNIRKMGERLEKAVSPLSLPIHVCTNKYIEKYSILSISFSLSLFIHIIERERVG